MINLSAEQSNLGVDFRFQPQYNLAIKQLSKYVDNYEKLTYD